jgi:hypothetical protein
MANKFLSDVHLLELSETVEKKPHPYELNEFSNITPINKNANWSCIELSNTICGITEIYSDTAALQSNPPNRSSLGPINTPTDSH